MSHQTHAVSLIIPTYNRAGLLAAALDSVLSQSRVPDEIIVVNDGSTDQTADVLARYAPAVTAIHQGNNGRSHARNAGIRAAQGDLIAFLDDDDLLPPESIAQRAAYLETHPDVDVVYTDMRAVDESGEILGALSKINPQRPSGDVFAAIAHSNLAQINAFMCRRACLDRPDLFDEALSIAEDWDFWIRIAADHHFGYLDAPLAYYRVHRGMTSANSRDQLAEGGIAVQRRVFALPAFQRLAPKAQARIYQRHATWHIRLNALATARHYYRRAITTAPDYLPPYGLLALLSLFGWALPDFRRNRLARQVLHLRKLHR
ncbi:MAG: glycosyltransferase [Chloroflexi bacterium]|nr:glycosyltransferase [Chloroflexota bacterium]